MTPEEHRHDLIVTIVPKGGAERIMRASLEAGAQGGTIMYGRGIGIHETRTVLGIPIEPEKEILLTVVPCGRTRAVLSAVVSAGELDTPGKGIAFTLSVGEVVGTSRREAEMGENE